MKNDVDMTTGNYKRQILLFMFPLIFSGLLQNIYSITDIVMAGRFIGIEAVSGIGNAIVPLLFLNSLIAGFSSGILILESNIFASQKKYSIFKSVFFIFIFLSLFLLTLGIVFFVYGIKFMGLNSNVLLITKDYFSIMTIGLPFVVGYNFILSFIKARGNSKIPLIMTFFSTIVNIFLNYCFVLIFEFGIKGIAFSTVISQLLVFITSSVYCYYNYYTEEKKLENYVKTSEIIKSIIELSSTSLIQNMVSTMSSLYIQKIINTFGVISISSIAAGAKIEGFLTIPVAALGTSIGVYISQNYGNDNFDRMKLGFKFATKISVILNIIVLIFVLLFGNISLKLILKENKGALELGFRYLLIFSLFYFPLSMLYILSNFLRSSGKIKIPIMNVFLELVSRIFFVIVLSNYIGVNGILLSRPLSFIVSGLNLYIFISIYFKNKKKGMYQRNEKSNE